MSSAAPNADAAWSPGLTRRVLAIVAALAALVPLWLLRYPTGAGMSTATIGTGGPSGIPDPQVSGVPAQNYAVCFAGGRLELKIAQ